MRISLAEEIREISKVAPKDFDPDEVRFELEDEEEDRDHSAATEHYLLELGYVRTSCFLSSLCSSFIPRYLSPSALRKAQDSLSDPKYLGKRVSRAQLLDNDDDGEQSPPIDSQVEDSESDNESQAAQEDGESDALEPDLRQEAPRVDVAQTINQTRQEDRKKGLAVSRQLVRLAGPSSYNNLTSLIF